ncbi:MAG: NlpC/P60 family protein [Bdellovibrionota bacterium]
MSRLPKASSNLKTCFFNSKTIASLLSIILSSLFLMISFQSLAEDQITEFDNYARFESTYPNPARTFRQFDYELTQNFLTQEELTYHAINYAKLAYVPYIWGGGTIGIGNSNACSQCKKCIKKRNVSIKKRFTACKACRKCGIDCSHLVNKIFEKSDLPVPYGSTKDLLKLNAKDLKRLYSLVYVGRNPQQAQVGDLILYPGHIVLLLENNEDGTGSIIHATASKKNSKFGGIVIETVKLSEYAGGIRKILRHRKLLEAANHPPSKESPSSSSNQHNS